MKIDISPLIGSPFALLHDDGLKIYKAAIKEFDKKHPKRIEIDFSGIKRCSTLFLNASFGKLLSDLGTDVVSSYITPVGYGEINSFATKYSDMWDNFENKDNYQAYRELELA